jgi:parvulin-like peptidyl-prolyl isomerase
VAASLLLTWPGQDIAVEPREPVIDERKMKPSVFSSLSSLVQESVNALQLSFSRSWKRSIAINTSKRTFTLATVTLLVASLGGWLMSTRRHAAAQTKETAVVATVEGMSISAKLFKMYLKNDIDSLVLDGRTPEGKAQIERLKEGIVADLVDRALIEAECRRRHLTASDTAFAEAYQKAVSEFGSERAYRSYLSENNLTDEEFRLTTRQNVYGELLRNELDKEVSVNDAEIADFYARESHNPAFEKLFNEQERVTARHILVAARASQIASDIQGEKLIKSELDRRVAREIAARHSRAEAILARARAGSDFGRLAKEYSDDFATRERGGDLGSFTRNTHTAPFDEAAFGVKAGQISPIVETEYGFHIIKVIAHSMARLRTLNESRSAIQEDLLGRKRAAHLRAWLEGRRREADIRLDPAYRFGPS